MWIGDLTRLCLRESQEQEDYCLDFPVEREPVDSYVIYIEHSELNASPYQLINHSATYSAATKAPTTLQYIAHRSSSGSETGL